VAVFLDVKAHWSALLLLAARDGTPYSRAFREQQQCTKQRSMIDSAARAQDFGATFGIRRRANRHINRRADTL
jgi:hypothetical protein